MQQYLEHGTCKHPTDYKSEVWRSVSRVKTPCEQGLPHYTCYNQSNAFLMQRKGRRSAVSPWNVDLLLRSTTMRRIRSARSGLLGQRSFRSTALNQKSCHASVAVMLEKRGGCCRTDGPIRVQSCQMRHTIAAIKARGVALCVEAPLRVRSTPPAARSSPQLAASAEPLVTDAKGSNRRFITGLLHISDVTPARRAQGTTLSILRASVACAAAVQTAVLVLFFPWLGHY